MIKKIVYFVLCILVLQCPAMAGNSDDVKAVEQLLKEKMDAVLSILQKKDIDEEAKKQQIVDTLESSIDFQLMAKLTLGKANWGKLDVQQQEEFVSLFVKRLKVSYLDKTSFYNDEKLVYKPGIQKGNKVYIPVEIVTAEKPIELLYKFYRAKQGWKAYDIEINGVSLIKSYQAQFNEMLRNGSGKTLIDELKKEIQEKESADQSANKEPDNKK